jgi:hypothetical protein
MFSKIFKLTHRWFKSSPSIYSNWIGCVIFLFFSLLRFTSAQLVLSPRFSLHNAASPPANDSTPSRCVTLPSHGAKRRSLPPLHLSATFRLITLLLKLKSKYWICTAAAGHPPQTALPPPSTVIKSHFNIGHSSHHSTVSLFYLLTRQSTTSS